MKAKIQAAIGYRISRKRTLRRALASLRAAALLAMAALYALPAHAQWSPVPLVTQASRTAGNTGGEGCQWPQGLAIDSTGNFMLYGTDVGGIFRSTNAGAQWEPCNVGYKPRGTAGMAIDPNNSNRCISIGGNSSAWGWHGVWLSTDQGLSWTNPLPKSNGGYRDFRYQVAYDKGSLSGGMSTIVYWSMEGTGGLYKSTDGGASWAQVNTGFGGSHVAVHPTAHYVYIANSSGFFKSTNGGASFTQKTSGLGTGAVTGLDVVSTQVSNVYVCKADGVYVSTDSGETFSKRTGTGLPLGQTPGIQLLRVSPGNVNNMAIMDRSCDYCASKYYSTNGGSSWAQSADDNSQSLMPANGGRTHLFAWNPASANVVTSFGSDFMMRSTNSGANYAWFNNGNNGVLISSIFNFNASTPDLLMATSQDYNGVLTTDAGYTWKYLPISGQGWGGYTYAGFAFTSSKMFAGNATSWGGTRILRTSSDGGTTWVDTGHAGSGTDTACGDPGNVNIGFWDNWRTTDQGATWNTMTNCSGVYTYNPTGSKELYGGNGSAVVKSTDHGVTWTTVATFASNVHDIAYDQTNNRIYAIGDNRTLYQWQGGTITDITSRLPTDNNGAKAANTVACDPVNPSIVYEGAHQDIYTSTASVARSTDSGVTWTNLTKQPGGSGLDGASEGLCIRVHPVSRYAYVTTSCFGIWKYPPPASIPPAPAGLTATAGNAQVALSWSASSGATSYNAKRSTTSGSGYANIATGVATTSYTNTGLTNGTTYYFVVSAVNASGESANSSQASATPVPSVPQAQIAAGTATIDGTVEAAWNNATSYSLTKTTGTISGASDCSATWKAMWDSGSLYVLVDVTDDVKVNDSTGTYDDDSVEIYLDADHNGGTIYDTNDRQLVYGWGDAAVIDGGGRTTTGVTSAQADPTSTTYRFETKIPWSLEAYTPAANNIIGIDVHVNDDDDGGARDGKVIWNDGTDQAWNNPSLFGTGKLIAAPSTVATPAFSPASGTYTTSKMVTLSDTTSGAAIHYTTDGSTPTAASATYSSPIVVRATTTIKAIGTASGMTDSLVASGVYTINYSGPQIVFAATAPTIDGNNTDAVWSSAPSNSITHVSGTISSSADLSGSWKAAWDSGSLYVLVDVTDDVKMNDSTGVYDDDSVEVYIDGDNNKAITYDANDVQYQFGWGDAAASGGSNSTGKMTGVIFAKTDPTSTTYRIEAKMPWSNVATTPVMLNNIGFDVHINDDDDGGARDGKLMWNDIGDTAWQDTSKFGTAMLN